MPKRTILLALLAAALAVPADALAADRSHVWLTLSAARLGNGWTLTGASASGDYYPNGKEILGVTLNRRLSASAAERHALRAALAQATVRFDGRVGRWQAHRVNGVLDVDMAIAATGEAQPAGEALGCRGPLARVPVRLTGTFVLRTGTKTFGTVRRARLSGAVTYNDGGRPDCGATAGACSTEEWLTASSGRRQLVVSPERRTLTLSFPEAGGWYHVLERRGVEVTGAPPAIRVAAAGLGAVTFSAGTSVEDVSGPCRVVTTEGTLTGSFAHRFTGWGGRTFRATSARYTQQTPR